MISITSSRIKKALLHPQAALLYWKNYWRGEIIRWKCHHPRWLAIHLDKILGKDIYSRLEEYFLTRKEPVLFQKNDPVLEKAAQQDFIIPAANKILRQEFGFLGMNPKKIKAIDWNEDLKSGHHWPYSFYLDLRENLIKDYNKGWDIKMVWELSCFHYLVPLALAYYRTGEELYFRKWQDLISDWIKKNPVYYGPNWINAMEVAIRSCNWILSWEIIKARGNRQEIINQLEKDFLERFVTSLIHHGRFIYDNLEYAPFPSNHYLSDLTGLFFLGIMFPEVKEAQKWLRYSYKALEKEVRRQIYQDGVDYELSISYHRYVLELLLWDNWLARQHHLSFSSYFQQQLRKMTEFSWASLKPNGLAPQIGDSDDSRLFYFYDDWYAKEKRNYLSLFRLYELSRGEKWNQPPQRSRAFPKAGYYIMRDSSAQLSGYESGADKDFYLITGRNKGCFGKGGSHVHNDVLSFELNFKGEDFVVDPGTGEYTAHLSERNLFRSTAFHNTVRIDGKEQNPLPNDPFLVNQFAQLKVRKWLVSGEEFVWEGEHTGYLRLLSPVIHKRRFAYSRREKILTIEDSFEGKGNHHLEWNFHLDPAVKVWMKDTNTRRKEILLMGRRNSVLFSAPQELNCVVIPSFVSPSYGVKIPSKTIRFSGFWDEEKEPRFEFQFQLMAK